MSHDHHMMPTFAQPDKVERVSHTRETCVPQKVHLHLNVMLTEEGEGRGGEGREVEVLCNVLPMCDDSLAVATLPS